MHVCGRISAHSGPCLCYCGVKRVTRVLALCEHWMQDGMRISKAELKQNPSKPIVHEVLPLLPQGKRYIGLGQQEEEEEYDG